MKRSELKQIIREVIEEGRGDVSSKMRQRIAQKKFKERHKYTRPELESMSSDELDQVWLEDGDRISVDAHDEIDEIENDQIESILDNQEV
jgi:hypothetical protein